MQPIFVCTQSLTVCRLINSIFASLRTAGSCSTSDQSSGSQQSLDLAGQLLTDRVHLRSHRCRDKSTDNTL